VSKLEPLFYLPTICPIYPFKSVESDRLRTDYWNIFHYRIADSEICCNSAKSFGGIKLTINHVEK